MKTKQNTNVSQMKNIFLLLLLFTGMVKAQILTIPDGNFKAKLLAADVTNQIAQINGVNSRIDTNNDGEIQLSEASLVTGLNVTNASISDLTGIESFTNIINLFCYQNQLSSLNVSGLIFLRSLYCQDNQLTSINITGITNLYVLHCENNQLTALDFSGNTSNNLFVDCSNNNLSTLFIKNGWNVILSSTEIYCQCSRNIYFFNNPNLTYVCCDDGEIDSIQALSGTTDYSNFTVNSYCSFAPGGNYNTITGDIKFDGDNNGCDATDLPQPNIRVNINDGTISGASFSSSTGNYTFLTQAGSFEITPAIENPSWFNFSPVTATIPFGDNNNNTATQDFCIAANGFHPDVEVVISPVFFARPGFDATYQITYRNKGNQTFSEGLLGFQYNDAILDFVSASQATFSQTVGNINWQYTNLLPFESRTISVTLNVNSPTETPAVNIGDELNFVVSTFPLEADENPQDNTFAYVQTVVGSYDPNDITCLEGDLVPPSEIGNYLHYAINFENTGNFPAENVVVKTEVDASKFDIGSLQLMTTNFPVDARITGNKVEFIFESIQLPIGGHGHILLKIKTQNMLVTGDAVANRADIFFDYNFPIDTGLANTVFQTLSNSVFDVDNSVVVYPNPAVNEVTIKADHKIKSIQLYDAQGRIITTRLMEVLESKLDISSHSKGIYFMKIITEKGAQVQKLLKE